MFSKRERFPFPTDVLGRIVEYMDFLDTVRCSKVSTVWRQCMGDMMGDKESAFMNKHFKDYELESLKSTTNWGPVVDKGDPTDINSKVTMVGTRGCGSSILVEALHTEQPVNIREYRPTIGVDFKVKTLINPEAKPPVTLGKLQLWDKPVKKNDFRALCRMKYRLSNMHLLVYNTSCGFENFVNELKNDAICAPCILVGTMCDLPPNPLTANFACCLAHVLRIPHVRTSAVTGEGIPTLLELVTGQCVRVASKRRLAVGGTTEEQKPEAPQKKKLCSVQ